MFEPRRRFHGPIVYQPEGKPGEVDRANRVIRDAAVLTLGEAKGHGMWLDQEFADELVRQGNNKPMGIKARFTHPGMSADGGGKVLGRMRNFYMDGPIVRGELHILKAADESPAGKLGTYVMSLAEEDPGLFGNSIVFSHDSKAEEAFQKANEKDGAFVSPDPANSGNLPHARLGELFGADAVDSPAANPSGFFGEGDELAARAESICAYAFGLTEIPPDEFAIGDLPPDKIRTFLNGFLVRHNLEIVTAKPPMQPTPRDCETCSTSFVGTVETECAECLAKKGKGKSGGRSACTECGAEFDSDGENDLCPECLKKKGKGGYAQTCSACGKGFELAAAPTTGKEVTCPECGHTFMPGEPMAQPPEDPTGVLAAIRTGFAELRALLAPVGAALRAITYNGAHPNGTPKAAKTDPWNGPQEVTAATVEDLGVMCAWVETGREKLKTAYKLPHHKAAGGHAVVWRGVAQAAARLPQTQMPDADRPGVRSHLGRHYSEFGEKPPWTANSAKWGQYEAAVTTMAALGEVPETVLVGLLRSFGFDLEADALAGDSGADPEVVHHDTPGPAADGDDVDIEIELDSETEDEDETGLTLDEVRTVIQQEMSAVRRRLTGRVD